MFMTALNFIRAKIQVEEITVNSSPYAEKIYKKMGFTATAPEQITNGIRYIPLRFQINVGICD